MKARIKLLFLFALVSFVHHSNAQIFEVDIKVDKVIFSGRPPIDFGNRSVTVRFTEVSEIVTIGRIADYLIGVQFEVLESKSLQSPYLFRETFFTRPDRNELWTAVGDSDKAVVFYQLIGNHREIEDLAFSTKAFDILYSLSIYRKYEVLRNFLYVEAGGNSFLGSINYECQLTKKPGLGARVGIGFAVEGFEYITFPIAVNYLVPLKRKTSFFEASIGYTHMRAIDASDQLNFLVPSVGLRKHFPNKAMIRFSVTPFFSKQGNEYNEYKSLYVFPWAGFSFGKSF